MKTTTKTIKLMLLSLFFSITSYGADLFVYPNAQSPDYADIQTAVSAASSGDNIYIDTATFIGNVTISNKSLNLYPLHKGGMFTINGNLSLTLTNNNVHIYIQGLSGGGLSASSNSTTNSGDSCTLVLNGCEFTSEVNVNPNGYSNWKLYSLFYYSTFNDNVFCGPVEFMGNTFIGEVSVRSSYWSGSGERFTHKIYANNFSFVGEYDNLYIYAPFNDVHIANNVFNESYYQNLQELIYCNSMHKLIIENNVLYNYNYANSSTSYQRFARLYSMDFCFVRNNYFRQLNNGYQGNIYTNGVAYYDFQYNWHNSTSFSSGSGTIQTIANNTSGTLGYNTMTGIVTSTGNNVDGGSPLPECRDINNTRNDIGTYGGPHSWNNYHSTSSSMAQILDLEIPYYQIVLPGQQIQFKSKAIHKNE